MSNEIKSRPAKPREKQKFGPNYKNLLKFAGSEANTTRSPNSPHTMPSQQTAYSSDYDIEDLIKKALNVKPTTCFKRKSLKKKPGVSEIRQGVPFQETFLNRKLAVIKQGVKAHVSCHPMLVQFPSPEDLLKTLRPSYGQKTVELQQQFDKCETIVTSILDATTTERLFLKFQRASLFPCFQQAAVLVRGSERRCREMFEAWVATVCY